MMIMSGPVVQGNPEINLENTSEAPQGTIGDLSISCEDLDHCPDYVGGLFTVTQEDTANSFIPQWGIGLCSQTLIAPDKILTNRHCLPEQSLEPNLPCSNITVIFPKTKSKEAEIVGCQSVIALSEEIFDEVDGKSTLEEDWAILQLDRPVRRTPIEISLQGVPHQANLTAFPVYYEKSKVRYFSDTIKPVVKGQIKKVSCLAHMNSALIPTYNYPHNSILSLVCNRKVIGGNSGSGLISDGGKLSGVLSVVLKNFEGQTFAFMGSTDYQFLGGYTVGATNTQCIDKAYKIGKANRAYSREWTPFCVRNKNESEYANWMLTVFYGSTLFKDSLQEISKDLLRDPTIQWEDHNKHFFQNLSRPRSAGRLSELVTSPVFEYFYTTLGALLYPKTPQCIKSSRRGETFSLMLPQMVLSYGEMNLNEYTLFTLPLKLKFLKFGMTYDASLDSFRGTPLRLGDTHLKEKFLDISKKISKGLLQCMFAKQECHEFDKRLNEREKLLEGTDSTQKVLLENELFIQSNQFGAIDIYVPVCIDK